MIPIYDDIPKVHTPVAMYAILAINVLVFLYEISLGPAAQGHLFYFYGVVPMRYVNPDWAAHVGLTGSALIPPFTYMFLHGGWLHIILNMWMLWIFADNIEDVMGPLRFVAFYLVCGLIAVAMHVFFNPDSRVPIIGASGGVAGVLGAYFLLYPHGKVRTLIPIIIIPLFFDIPAIIFLGIWFGFQIISGMAAGSGGGENIAFWAHVGGFMAGLFLIRFFRKQDRCYYCWNPEGRNYQRDK